eukprot:8291976-Alexandrium_andersonii.AAC.1
MCIRDRSSPAPSTPTAVFWARICSLRASRCASKSRMVGVCPPTLPPAPEPNLRRLASCASS